MSMIEAKMIQIIGEEYGDDFRVRPTVMAARRIRDLVKTRTATTAEELSALPEGSVVLDKSGNPWAKTDVDFWQVYGTFNDSAGLLLLGPLTVIHEARP